MFENPRLKYNFRAEFINGESALLLSEKKNSLLSGKMYNLVLAEIQRDDVTLDRLIQRLDGKVSPPEVIFALNLLKKEGYITQSTPAVSPGLCAYWNGMEMDVHTLRERLKEKPVSIQSTGSVPAGAIIEAFRAAGIHTGPNGALHLVITDDYESPELDAVNRGALETGQAWMLLKPTGVELWIGPIFVPGKTGCWACLKQRLNLNRPYNTFYKAGKNTDQNPAVPISLSPMSIPAAANLAAAGIVKWLYFGENPNLEGTVVSLDTSTLSTRPHTLTRRPQCPACGESPETNVPPRPVVLRQKYAYCLSSQGGYRDVPPEDTLERFRHHVSPITGVVQTLEPYFPDPAAPIYNYRSGHNIALRGNSMLWLNHHVRRENIGKGRTLSQARAGALCEAIERYSCTYHGEESSITASLEQLGDKGIHPNRCMNYSEKQYREREENNRNCTKLYFMVPAPFDPAREIPWTPVYSLTRETFSYLPSALCYNQFPTPDPSNPFCFPDTNGNAAGNSIEEAVLQGFLELVERDAVALWWYNRLSRPTVDLSSFNEPYFERLLEYYRSLNRGLYVLDITTDLQVPAFAAVSHRLDGDPRDILFAFGAHVEARIGIERALLEVNQLLPLAVNPEAGDPKSRYRIKDPQFMDWFANATLENQPYLAPRNGAPPQKASHYPALCEPNVYHALQYCIRRAQACQLEPYVLDMTRPDVGLNVVKVVVPGLRHFWKRLGPGRLYQVPRQMGWLDRPLKEEELNPIGVFI